MSIYRAIVVDDEPRVRKGLEALIPRLDPEWSVIGLAKNGLEAIELVKREMPDLVISDIRMPHMNGLDLLSALKEYPVHVVMLSGYGYFEYAQTALKFGAFDYLLKPVQPVQIESLLKRVKAHKQSMKPTNAGAGHPPLNFSTWWKQWLLGLEDTKDYTEKLRQELPSEASRYQILTIEIDRYEELIREDQWGDKQLVLFAVRNIIQELMADEARAHTALFSLGSRLTYLLVNQACNRELARRVIDTVQKWVRISISIGISEITDHFGSLPALYRNANEALENTWIYGDGLVCHYEDIRTENREAADYPAEIDEAIVRAVRSGHSEKATLGLAKFMDKVREGNLPFRMFRRLSLQLLSSVFRIVYEYKLQERVKSSILQSQELFHRDYTADEFIQFMSGLFDTIASSLEWNRQQKHNRTLDKVIAFIHSNYARDLSLDEVASHVQMSGSYLSSFFKQETGETYTEYVTRLRIEKAKTLMMNAELRLYEICQLVGYQDVKYFSRLFKRIVGVTPVEYRQFFYLKEG